MCNCHHTVLKRRHHRKITTVLRIVSVYQEMALQQWILFLLPSLMILAFTGGEESGDKWFYIVYTNPKTKWDCVFDGSKKVIECKDIKQYDDAQMWQQRGDLIYNKKTGNVLDAQKGLKEGVNCITYKPNGKGSDNQKFKFSPEKGGLIANTANSNLVLTMGDDNKCTIQKKKDNSKQQQFTLLTAKSG